MTAASFEIRLDYVEQKKAHRAGQMCHGTIQARNRQLYGLEVYVLLWEEIESWNTSYWIPAYSLQPIQRCIMYIDGWTRWTDKALGGRDQINTCMIPDDVIFTQRPTYENGLLHCSPAGRKHCIFVLYVCSSPWQHGISTCNIMMFRPKVAPMFRTTVSHNTKPFMWHFITCIDSVLLTDLFLF